MKLNVRQQTLIGFMLFSLFFGAGNLIFPPFLGNNAGDMMPIAFLGFIIPAVVLPVLGVIAVAQFDGLDKLAGKVGARFSLVFTIIIYLSIGPGLGIPRAASVPFEMAIMPYLGKLQKYSWLFMLIYSLVFFAIVLWLAMTPTKLVKRIGYVLTPSLLVLLLVLFITYTVKGDVLIHAPIPAYQNGTFLKGFVDGYQTMDTIAALNFGLVISQTLYAMGLDNKKSVVKYTVKTGIVAGGILTFIYFTLCYIGRSTSGLYAGAKNGAEILRKVVYMLFGDFGAVVIAAIFTLACLTTCVGLVTSISEFFSQRFKNVKYKTVVFVVVLFSLVICNLGLNLILSISVPVLNAIYPMSIMLILLGLFNFLYKKNRFIYPVTIGVTGVCSLVFVMYNDLKLPWDGFWNVLRYIPGFDLGFGWVPFAALAIVVSLILEKAIKRKPDEPLPLEEVKAEEAK